jgi:hypothetical protein
MMGVDGWWSRYKHWWSLWVCLSGTKGIYMTMATRHHV